MESKVQPFDSFTLVYKTLVWAGYSKILNTPTNRLKHICHQIYRPLAFCVVIVFNVQHLIFTVQKRNDMDKLLECLMIEIPQINLLVKLVTFNIQISRIFKINDALKDPEFAANNESEEEILKSNKYEMHYLSIAANIAISVAAIFWTISYFAKRIHDEKEVVSSYFPFKTNTWATFTLSVFMETGPSLWVAHGHIALDCIVVTYFAQIQAQLKIIKNNLEHLSDASDRIRKHDEIRSNRILQYEDVLDNNISKRFVEVVKRYERLVWYTNEVNQVFNVSISFQFLTSSAVVCMVIYKMTVTNVLSAPFLFLVVFFFILLTQVCLYCYYGNLVEYESRSLNNSLYQSDWLSLSPRFRRQLLIAMCRWSLPMKPRVCGAIPLSLNTFISIVKSSYTLYTVLSAAKQI